jgi:hypothetical protein
MAAGEAEAFLELFPGQVTAVFIQKRRIFRLDYPDCAATAKTPASAMGIDSQFAFPRRLQQSLAARYRDLAVCG